MARTTIHFVMISGSESTIICRAIAMAMALPMTLNAAELIPPASQRFADATTLETPDFQQHVVPLLGRLGCNGRACHGSFQGRGGFRLSLFGYDFRMDHAALTGGASSNDATRVNSRSPGESLIILKPSLELDHEGGQRFQLGSWEHHLFSRWIESGARGVANPRELRRLEIDPREVLFREDAKPIPLRVTAIWEDGASEDVTELCRFRTNDDSIVTVDRDGRLRFIGRGDTHVIAFYDNGVAAVPVIRPVAERTDPSGTSRRSATRIDELIDAKLHKLGITASLVCTDVELLRRASIDLTGTLPTPQEIDAFREDRSPDKRRHKMEELLDRPAYAAWWANKLCDFTGCNPNQQAELGQETSVQWYMWIYSRLRENVPYDELIQRIVLALGRHEGQSYGDYATEISSYYREQSPADFASRRTMPHFWTRRTLEEPADKALAFAHSFLGIRLQCAQCHKHPFAPWTQADFQQFTRFFENVQYGVPPSAEPQYRQMAASVGLNIRGKNGSPVRKEILKHAQAGRAVPWRELYVAMRAKPERLSLLRDETVDLARDEDPRQAIMQWMKQPDNPWFARALVNRVWASYFHVGIIDPPDDLSPANPPSNPELLDWLTSEFIQHGYDMRWLHREIVLSDAYQRSWKPNDSNREDRRNFSRAIPRRLPAEVVYDALKQATASTDQMDDVRSDLTRRAIGHLSMRLAGTYAMRVFGKPERAANCDCERVTQPTLLQSVFLQNDPLVEQRLSASGWIGEISAAEEAGDQLDLAELVRNSWLRTVGRPPTSSEMDRALRHLGSVNSVSEGIRDLMWALINTKEFILNR